MSFSFSAAKILKDFFRKRGARISRWRKFVEENIYEYGSARLYGSELIFSLRNPPLVPGIYEDIEVEVDGKDVYAIKLRKENVDLDFIPLEEYKKRGITLKPGERLYIKAEVNISPGNHIIKVNLFHPIFQTIYSIEVYDEVL